jgi:hypothetical protein
VLRDVSVLDLVRTAGLHPCPPRPLAEVVLLLPGYLVAGVTRRALDLGLTVRYRPTELSPLFDETAVTQAGYEVTLSTGRDAVIPASLIAALDRDPFILVCRRAADTVLIRIQLASPLPDRALASLSAADEAGATWVFADPSFGCGRLRPVSEARDGTSLIGLGDDHALTDVSEETLWAEPADSASEAAPPSLALSRAAMSGTAVDAALLDDADLACLPALLAGEPLAESAVVIRGRDQHLVTAPGGLLEQLPVGVPLYCLGPGSLYLPLGYRLSPALPPAARMELFPTSASSAIVVMPSAALRYNLTARSPVWTLWAGELPELDDQVPAAAADELSSLDATTSVDPAKARASEEAARSGQASQPARPSSSRPGIPTRPRPPGMSFGQRDRTWRDEAYQAELAGDLVRAADLHLQHNDPQRAARLYERAAERS